MIGRWLRRTFGGEPAPGRWSMYTVFDGTGAASPLALGNVLLLAASWRRHVRPAGDCPLVIVAVRARNEALLRKLEELGARIEPVDRPHALCGYSRTYNKLLGLQDQKADEARLLVDNDVACVSGLGRLRADALRHVMADFADRQRVTDDVVCEIRDKLDLGLPQGDWWPMKERYEALVSGREPPVYRDMYFSSGVVASPVDSRLPALWEQHSRRICRQFRDRYQKQKQRGAFGSDQLALGTAMRDHGDFRFLPAGYNYRMFGFLCGHLPADDIHVVHHVAVRRSFTAMQQDQQQSLGAIMRNYYENFMVEAIRSDGLPDADVRAETAVWARDRVLSVIKEFDIDDLRMVADAGQVATG